MVKPFIKKRENDLDNNDKNAENEEIIAFGEAFAFFGRGVESEEGESHEV